MKNQNKPSFSIVIPALNEEKYLPLLLRDLAKQDFKNFEVIVVEGSSEDKTVAVAQNFEKRLSLHIFSVEKRNVSFQRNFGAEKAKAEWVIFMDADDRIEPFFLQGILYQIAKKKNIDVFTTWIEIKSTNSSDKLLERGINLSMEISDRILKKPQCFGALLGCRKELTQKYRFDENHLLYEDSYFVQKLNDEGYTFVIFHDPCFTFSLRRIKKEGKAKTIYNFMFSQLRYLRGGDFSKPLATAHYPMLGGSYYSEEKDKAIKDELMISIIPNFIKSASQKQLEQARKILNSIMDTTF